MTLLPLLYAVAPVLYPVVRTVRVHQVRRELRRAFNQSGIRAVDGSGEVFTAFCTLGPAAGVDRDRIRILVSSEPEVNAGSAGDCRFIVTHGLTVAPSPVIWGVIAHELAHDRLGHMGSAVKIDGARAVAEFLLGGGPLLSGGLLVTEFLYRRYERGQELDADDDA